MGACASMPKAMRGVDGAAPPPGPPKEETTAAAIVPPSEPPKDETTTDKEVTVEGGEKKAGGGDDSAKPEDEKNKDGDRRSLGSLLESEEVKELPKTEKISPDTQTIAEEQKSAALPVSDKAAEEPAQKDVAPYVAPVARATEEDKETENK
ncbi:hypothetical protein RHMOL_Rhmol05G0158100 [Rhododendron molle]|uniref:Uncharacterized protein n=1 Tax=Rhododendron molle TaxID=49168 RepID=A0ACC0NR56_RHOML|nr:hypothetical protein RHMOL_Rhmol05G0158100 [Rhododendron molle]